MHDRSAPLGFSRMTGGPIDWFLAAEPAVKISMLALAWSLVTTGLAAGSLVAAIRSLNATKRQEARRQPKLVVTYLQSSYLTTDLGTEYTFRVRAQNPTDANNSITSVELEIHYRIDESAVALRLSGMRVEGALLLPAAITAGSSLEGDVRFFCPVGLLDGRHPRDFLIKFVDTFNNKTSIPVEIVYNRAGEV